MPVSRAYKKSHVIRKAVDGNEVDLFLDYNCPFSAKLFLNFEKSFIPLIEKKYPGEFSFNFINVIQPWHPNSTLLHEVSLAVAKIKPDKFLEFSKVLFENKEDFYDTATLSETRNETYKRLAKFAEDKVNVPASEILKLVEIKPVGEGEPQSNAGNQVAKDVKYFTRYHRTVGVHVTPTVFVNGIQNNAIESSTPNDKLVEIFESYL